MSREVSTYIISAGMAFIACYSLIRPQPGRHRGGIAFVLLLWGGLLMSDLVFYSDAALGVRIATGIAAILSATAGGVYLRVHLPAFRDKPNPLPS